MRCSIRHQRYAQSGTNKCCSRVRPLIVHTACMAEPRVTWPWNHKETKEDGERCHRVIRWKSNKGQSADVQPLVSMNVCPLLLTMFTMRNATHQRLAAGASLLPENAWLQSYQRESYKASNQPPFPCSRTCHGLHTPSSSSLAKRF